MKEEDSLLCALSNSTKIQRPLFLFLLCFLFCFGIWHIWHLGCIWHLIKSFSPIFSVLLLHLWSLIIYFTNSFLSFRNLFCVCSSCSESQKQQQQQKYIYIFFFFLHILQLVLLCLSFNLSSNHYFELYSGNSYNNIPLALHTQH